MLVPPAAFLLYLVLVAILSGIGRAMAGTHHPSSAFKAGAYASGGLSPVTAVYLLGLILALVALIFRIRSRA